MNYLSVCSGIESATCAWHSLGWNPIGFSEIEPFPCKVLAHHYPNVPNFGDMTKFKEWPDANIDVLVGGTPCQSFSIAGLRKGLDDPRGNLMLTYLAIADRYKPKYIVWENVAGILSSNGGRDFGTFLGGLGQLGYGFAYRVLDAQFCRTHEHPRAVPQRRRRVFVVGCLGSWRSAAGILFDSESLRGNPPPGRNKGQEIAGTTGARTGVSIGAQDEACGHILPVTYADVSLCLTKGSGQRYDYETETFVPAYALAGNTICRAPKNGGNHIGYDDTGSSYTLTKTDVHAVAYIGGIDYENNGHGMDVTGPLMKGSPTGGGRPLPAVVYQDSEYGVKEYTTAGTLRSGRDPHHQMILDKKPVEFGIDGAAHCLRSGASKADKPCSTTYVRQQMRVRRLTPLECERLQGFPDNFTNIPGASNTARYKALGNSMAVNCMRILGERIEMAESIKCVS